MLRQEIAATYIMETWCHSLLVFEEGPSDSPVSQGFIQGPLNWMKNSHEYSYIFLNWLLVIVLNPKI